MISLLGRFQNQTQNKKGKQNFGNLKPETRATKNPKQKSTRVVLAPKIPKVDLDRFRVPDTLPW